MSAEEKTEFFALGDRASLICGDSTTTDAATDTLRELGFKFHTAETPELAIERIRYTDYDCIILDENFAGSSLRSNAVLNFLNALPMGQRRNWFICLVGASFKTLDAMQAFAQSVHLVLNPVDLPNLTAILKKSLVENELLYGAYDDILAAMGGGRARRSLEK
jgi:DNA-binding response OmpR family regulator